MSAMIFALLAGIGFGVVDVLIMLPMDLPDKRTALLGAFLGRFAIGFLIPFSSLPLPGFVSAALVGLLISVPEAVITRAYAPIIGVGVIGGALIGWLAGRFVA